MTDSKTVNEMKAWVPVGRGVMHHDAIAGIIRCVMSDGPLPSGPPLSMMDAHEAQMCERTLQTAEQREAAARQGYQRLLNLEAAVVLAASITQNEIEAFLREVEACQQD